ncbi:hypothetical protein TD95_001605 [Thielaviopsis punctulata]|uniref:Core Histone H2A/H2B/H3 domain-containing protein n=1 Tax=Thielaviopsis punctulata TaxID=72032 RepID=A0A0F4ZH95_9PEZI|nr:hypothetical protein TD95_001605 [Thielaviopsis punctulata]
MDTQNGASSTAEPAREQAVYDTSLGGHYGASYHLAAQGFAPAELYTGPWANVHQGLNPPYRDVLTTYWQHTINHLESDTHDYKIHQLPLARIKKVMKADPDVKMISAEAPILFAKGCDIFITELTMRAWIHAEENKRRTLQRSDIASALSKSDMFDFLIDIVPREEAAASAKRSNAQTSAAQAQAQAQAQSQVMTNTTAPSAQISGAIPPAGGSATHMSPTDYAMPNHNLGGEEYRQPGTMYSGQPTAQYTQAQGGMYGEIDSMYYASMPSQQVGLDGRVSGSHEHDGPTTDAYPNQIQPEEYD